MSQKVTVYYHDWGLIDYREAWDRQEALFSEKAALKLKNRDSLPEFHEIISNDLIFCEHPHVFTLGKNGSESNLLAGETKLKEIDASFYRINRGGDITYHGPGQIVGYPILDLDQFFNDIHRYLRTLEDSVILTLSEYGVKGERLKGYTGVWLDASDPDRARKICALGVRCSRWITMHGFAFNVNTDLSYFKHIIPCGIDDKAVTSLEKETGKKLDMMEVKSILKHHIVSLFGMEVN